MKKVFIFSLVFLFYLNTPAHAGWINILGTLGEIAIKKIDSLVDEAIDSIGDLYNRVSKGPSESQIPSIPPNKIRDLLGDVKIQSCGEYCEYIIFQGGYKIFRIGMKKYENQQKSSCKKGFEHRRLQNPTYTIVYQLPSQEGEPLGYYEKKEVVCTKVDQSNVTIDATQESDMWYQSEDGWFLETKTAEKPLTEYILGGRNLQWLDPSYNSCDTSGYFLVEVVEPVAIVYSNSGSSILYEAKGFYNKNESVCVLEERITKYPETWYRTQYGWAKKMDFKRQ